MKVVHGIKNLKESIRGSVVTIGVFDGVHIGHKRVIDKAVSRARELRLESVVLTFDPHPAKMLEPRPSVPSLISLDHRIRLIGALGVDTLVVVKFTRKLAALSPERFVKDVLVRRLGAKCVYVGENFYFGAGAKAGVNKLKRIAAVFGVEVAEVQAVKVRGRIASSSLARALISKGDLDAASKILGRPVSVLGTVVRGSRLARELGYPTANINPHHEAIPPAGVYAVKVRLDKSYYKGVLNIGVRPTFYAPRDRETEIEVHIFNFKNNIYGRDIEVFFIKKIRDEFEFEGRGALIDRIKLDEKTARAILLRPSAVRSL